jgi:hypothetical protein
MAGAVDQAALVTAGELLLGEPDREHRAVEFEEPVAVEFRCGRLRLPRPAARLRGSGGAIALHAHASAPFGTVPMLPPAFIDAMTAIRFSLRGLHFTQRDEAAESLNCRQISYNGCPP